VNDVGEPCEGKPHARFDGGREETSTLGSTPSGARRLPPTLLVRQSLRYLSYRERKTCASELRRIYTAADADAAGQVLDELTGAWADSKTRTAALQVWQRAWDRIIPFLAFPD
jgi:transposase-like protein